MKTIFTIVLSFLLYSAANTQPVIEKPTDTNQYLIIPSWDDYLKWNISQQSGSTAELSNYIGINTNGIALTYSFPSSGGWFDMHIPLMDTLTDAYPVVFFIRSAPTINDLLEIKFTDKDGSVFRKTVPLNEFSDKWTHIVVYLKDCDYAWGGDSEFNLFAGFSIAGSGNSSGSIWIDEIGIGIPGLSSSFVSPYDPDSTLPGIGFAQRRDLTMNPEDPLVVEYLKILQDISSISADLLPSQEDDQAQTFNNCLSAMAFITKDEKARAEKILDFYISATDINNTDITLQNFYYNGEARGFYQWVSINSRHAPPGEVDRWVGDMAWLLITCRFYEKKYNSDRYDNLVILIKNLLLEFYTEAEYGGYIRSGWRKGDSYLHEPEGHHEGNIDCYVALKLCGEDTVAQKIKIWLEHELAGKSNLPLDLYTWRVLAFGSDYAHLLNIPEYSFNYRKIVLVNGIQTMGFYHTADININNFWNDGTGHIACAYQAFGDKQRGYFYANQLDHLIIERVFGTDTCHTIPYTLNKTGGYNWVDPAKGFVSCAAWYILAKNGINPFMSENFTDILISGKSNGIENSVIRSFPNPFAESTTVAISLPGEALVTVEIYNLQGEKIQSLQNSRLKKGEYSFNWNGRNYQDYSYPGGIFILKVSFDKQLVYTGRIVKIPG